MKKVNYVFGGGDEPPGRRLRFEAMRSAASNGAGGESDPRFTGKSSSLVHAYSQIDKQLVRIAYLD
jgi:hypothetical protein